MQLNDFFGENLVMGFRGKKESKMSFLKLMANRWTEFF